MALSETRAAAAAIASIAGAPDPTNRSDLFERLVKAIFDEIKANGIVSVTGPDPQTGTVVSTGSMT